MRVFQLIVLSLMLFGAGFAQARSVLLPDDNVAKDSTASPNLGLVPAPPPQTNMPSVSAPVAPSPDVGSAASLDSVEKNVLGGFNDKVLVDSIKDKLAKGAKLSDLVKMPTAPAKVAITPGGALDKYTPEQQMMAKMVAAGLTPEPLTKFQLLGKQIKDDYAKKHARPPLILDDTPPMSIDDPHARDALIVKVSGAYAWGQGDLDTLKNALGYERADVPANCQLRLEAKVNTDNNNPTYKELIFTGAQATIKYGGIVKFVAFSSYAVCYPPKELPQNGAILSRSGDKLSVMLSNSLKCDVPPKASKLESLTVQYTGDDTVACAFK